VIDVLAVERAYVAAATGGVVPTGGDRARLPEALAALGAVASRYLAVGTPRTFGIIGDGELSLEAHRTWFSPREIRPGADYAARHSAHARCERRQPCTTR